MQNSFTWWKVCCFPPDVGGSEKGRLCYEATWMSGKQRHSNYVFYVGMGASLAIWGPRWGLHRLCTQGRTNHLSSIFSRPPCLLFYTICLRLSMRRGRPSQHLLTSCTLACWLEPDLDTSVEMNQRAKYLEKSHAVQRLLEKLRKHGIGGKLLRTNGNWLT